MTTTQRAILIVSLALLALMFVLIPVGYSPGYDWRWNVADHIDYRRQVMHLIFWVFASVITFFLTIPTQRRR